MPGNSAQQTNPICTYHHRAWAHGLHGQIVLGSPSKATNEAPEDVSHERIEIICFAGSKLFLIELGPNL